MGDTAQLFESRNDSGAAIQSQPLLFPPATAQPQEATAHGEDERAKQPSQAQSVASPSLPSTVAGLVSTPSGLTPALLTTKHTTQATGTGGASLLPESVAPPSLALSPEMSGDGGPEVGGRGKRERGRIDKVVRECCEYVRTHEGMLPNGEEFSHCTYSAQYLCSVLGGEVWGYDVATNKGATLGDTEGGHDFLIVGEWVVDVWAHLTYDLPAVVAMEEAQARGYGDPSKWERVPAPEHTTETDPKASSVLCHCLKCGEWWRTKVLGFECPCCGYRP